jgi:hypothetical protein
LAKPALCERRSQDDGNRVCWFDERKLGFETSARGIVDDLEPERDEELVGRRESQVTTTIN